MTKEQPDWNIGDSVVVVAHDYKEFVIQSPSNLEADLYGQQGTVGLIRTSDDCQDSVLVDVWLVSPLDRTMHIVTFDDWTTQLRKVQNEGN